MEEQLERIKYKLRLLKQSDKECIIFGAGKHRYMLNAPITMEHVRNFERIYKIQLPEGFAGFYTNVGNGGAGPYYGLEPIDSTIYADLDYKRKGGLLNPSRPFLHSAQWNMKFQPTVTYEEDRDEYDEQRSDFERQYYDPELMNGVLAVCNYGCAVSINLVVNGDEYGYMWTDDRGSDNGIYPSHELGNKNKITFLDWYELWLDQSLDEIRSKGMDIISEPEPMEEPRPEVNKPWWKFWN